MNSQTLLAHMATIRATYLQGAQERAAAVEDITSWMYGLIDGIRSGRIQPNTPILPSCRSDSAERNKEITAGPSHTTRHTPPQDPLSAPDEVRSSLRVNTTYTIDSTAEEQPPGADLQGRDRTDNVVKTYGSDRFLRSRFAKGDDCNNNGCDEKPPSSSRKGMRRDLSGARGDESKTDHPGPPSAVKRGDAKLVGSVSKGKGLQTVSSESNRKVKGTPADSSQQLLQGPSCSGESQPSSVERKGSKGEELVKIASDQAVQDAMCGPTRLTRTKAKAIAEKAAAEARDGSRDKQQEQQPQGNPSSLRAACKTVNKAKRVLQSKELQSGSKIIKVTHGPASNVHVPSSTASMRVRCNSASEAEKKFNFLQLWKKERTPGDTFLTKPSTSSAHKAAISLFPSNIVAGGKQVTGVNSLIKKNDGKGGAVTRHNFLQDRDQRLKELDFKIQDAVKKKEELMKKRIEEKSKKQTEKRQRVLSARDEKERERVLMQLLQERQREEKLRAFQLEKEKLLRERKEMNASRLQEAEDRRKQELEKKKLMASKELNTTFEVVSYDMTLNPEDRAPIPSKTADDYGLDDVCSDDSSDDETHPKKAVPKWAEPSTRIRRLSLEAEILQSQVATFFGSERSTPNLSEMFEDPSQSLLSRRSSAVWDQNLLGRRN